MVFSKVTSLQFPGDGTCKKKTDTLECLDQAVTHPSINITRPCLIS